MGGGSLLCWSGTSTSAATTGLVVNTGPSSQLTGPVTTTRVGIVINDTVRALAQGKNFAAFTTLLPSGQPQTHVVWVDCDDDHIVINTEVGLRKFKNVETDPRVTVAIWDVANPYSFVEVRGRVVETVTGVDSRANINALAQKYFGGDYPDELVHSERVILKIAPESQIAFAPGRQIER
jgi:PPOX class probable F420-dependent enzyme